VRGKRGTQKSWVVLLYSNSLEDIIDTTFGTAGYDVLPHLVFDVFVLVQYAPIRTVLCLEPLEIINLIIQVLNLCIFLGSLYFFVSTDLLFYQEVECSKEANSHNIQVTPQTRYPHNPQ